MLGRPKYLKVSNEFGGYPHIQNAIPKLTGEATTEGFQRYYDKIYEGVKKKFIASSLQYIHVK